MMFLGIFLSFAAVGFFCWLIFTLAIFALPFYAGLSVFLWCYGAEFGWFLSFLLGAFAAGLTLAVGQALFELVRPVWARLAIALAFVAPAAVAGYHVALGILRLTIPSEPFQIGLAIIGAMLVGGAAFSQMAGMAVDQPPTAPAART